MTKGTSIAEMLKHCGNMELHQFIIDYSNKNREFRKAFNDRFNPVKKITGDKKIYAGEVNAAFLNNPARPGNRYHHWKDYGFCAEDVAADLQILLDKARYFMEAGNVDEAILICQALIETIPGEWDPSFDHEGDVQVRYDGAIDLLQEMMEQKRLSLPQKEQLFQWYSSEHRNDRHKHVGLNTSLRALEDYFTDTPAMIRKTLSSIDEKINNAPSDYEKENAILNKIGMFRKIESGKEAEALIDQYIHLGRIRELRLETFMQQKEYRKAIALIEEGIQTEIKNNHAGRIISWKEKLFGIYTLQNNTEQALVLAEGLFYENRRDAKEYYDYIKKHTAQNNWPETVKRLLSGMDDNHWGFNTLKADILIERQMWDRLFALCLKAGTEHVEHYEKYLKPVYAKELFNAFHKYVEHQATITDKNAYMNVARVLKKMRSYNEGAAVVDSVLKHYREIYKKRRNMMKELEGV